MSNELKHTLKETFNDNQSTFKEILTYMADLASEERDFWSDESSMDGSSETLKWGRIKDGLDSLILDNFYTQANYWNAREYDIQEGIND